MTQEKTTTIGKGTASAIAGVTGAALIYESRNQAQKGNHTAGILLLCTGGLLHLMCLKWITDIKTEDRKHTDRLRPERQQVRR